MHASPLTDGPEDSFVLNVNDEFFQNRTESYILLLKEVQCAAGNGKRICNRVQAQWSFAGSS